MGQRTGIKAGQAFVTIDAIDKITPVLKRIWRNMGMFATQLRTIGRQMVIVGAAMGAVFGAAFGRMTSAASDFQESMNFFEQVFGDQTDDMTAWSFAFAESIGRSKLEIIELMARSKAMFDQFKLGEEDASEMSKALTQLAIDYASLRNLTDEAAFEKIQAAVQGRPVGLSLSGGVTILQEVVKERAMVDFGIDVNNVDFATKALLRLWIAHKELSEAHGDAVRTSRFLANTMKRLNAVYVDAKVAIAEQLLPAAVALGEFFLSTGSKAITFLKDNFVEIVLIALAVTTAFITMGVVLWAAGTAMKIAMALVTLSVWAYNAAVMVAQIATGLFSAVMYLLASGPLGVAALAIGVLIALMVDWGAVSGTLASFFTSTFGPNVSGVFGAIKTAFGGIVDAVKAGDLQLAWKIAWAGMEIIGLEAMDAILKAWSGLLSSFSKSWGSFVKEFKFDWKDLVFGVKTDFREDLKEQLRKKIRGRRPELTPEQKARNRRAEIDAARKELDALRKQAAEMDPIDLTKVEGMEEIETQMKEFQDRMDKLIREGAARGIQGKGGAAGDRPEFLQRGSEEAFKKIMELGGGDSLLGVNKGQLAALERLVEQGDEEVVFDEGVGDATLA